MKLCIALVVLGVFSAFSGPQTVSGHIAKNAVELTRAIYNGDVAAVEREVNAGNVNALNDLGENPLHVAIGLNEAQIVEKLIEKGANVNHVDLDGRTALQKAKGKPEIEEILRKHGKQN
ncbi:Poly [ADP-ribose] polymerase tankyrase-1 [Pseudolycoriella hygida]|uniref:Poly [ADP-ribose] polymerase tankyrase-1 n=1 Tax=Pseudolycoriella hygida TaxID=35572 RepID=A0A9Q0S1A8_9DIPT|nr:Poly [ADP-ribose] polymerase tankyrase-1 [Pseudolycoriella hygida]